MPIQFRCQHCTTRLSISRKMAGRVFACPTCGVDVVVPELDSPDAVVIGGADEPDSSGIRARPADAPSPATSAAAASPDRAIDEDDDEEDDDFRIKSRGLDDGGLDMTPMVDVTFLLLIFFMITASFSIQKSMQTEAPEPDDEGATMSISLEDLAEESVVVEIDAQDRIRVDDTPVASAAELVSVLESKIASEQKLEMLIESDYRASHGAVVEVTDAGMQAKMQRIRRASRKADE